MCDSCRRTMFLVTFILSLAFLAGSYGDYTDPHCGGKQVIVHLFEWKWTDVALECERFLSRKGFCGVQVSPANEHVMVTSPPAPWWERYQPVSYKLDSRSGTESEFVDMVNRCRAVGVRIYVDVVLNHMAGLNRNGTGSAGSFFNSDTFDFPGVPYTKEHFNTFCELNSYNDKHTIKDCYLVGLTDLDQNNEYVRNQLAAFLNKYIDLGVAGFRVDAAKHMWVKDMAAIQQRVKDMPEGGRPFFYHEVIDQSNGPVTSQEYEPLGYVTEFRYCQKIKEGIDDFGRLGGVVDYGWGMEKSDHAFVFVDNHDNQRGHGGNGMFITFEQPQKYKMAVAFTLANDYGFTRVMSSYYFGDNNDLGPPHNADYTTKDVQIGKDGVSCGNDWVCEHRWRSVANMVAFRNAVVGTTKENYYSQNNEVAFSRGNKGFFAMAKSGSMDVTLQTGLPPGEYCDLITECAKKVTVRGNGEAHIVINNPDEPVLAFIADGHGGGVTYVTSHTPMTSHVQQTSDGSNVQSSTPPDTSTFHTNTATSGSVLSPPAGMARTVIVVERRTNEGQDLFIRGGISHSFRQGCTDVAQSSACAIPIHDRDIGTGPHYDKYNAWSSGDHYLDWYGSEPGQGRYHGQMAQGTPAVWTTNDQNHPGYSVFNSYGPHYWLVDVDMDCSKTDNGWFEIKAVVNGQWEGNIRSGAACTGSGAGTPPGVSENHWARCGMLNIYHFGTSSCEIKQIL